MVFETFTNECLALRYLYLKGIKDPPPSSTAQPMDYHIANERKLLVGSQYFALSLLTQFFASEMN